MADPRWQEYKVVERHLARLDPSALCAFPALHGRVSKSDALLYLSAIFSAHDKPMPTVNWRCGGGCASARRWHLSLDHNPSLGLVLHEAAHLLTRRVSFSQRSKRGYTVRMIGSHKVKRHRARFASNDGQYIHHGPAFSRQLAELIREVC